MGLVIQARQPQQTAPATQGTPQVPDVRALEERAIELRAELNKLRAQRPILERQAREGQGWVQATAPTQLAQLELEEASILADLEAIQARIALRTGSSQSTTVQPPPHRSLMDRIDPDAVTAFAIISWGAIMIPLATLIARRVWRGKRPAAPSPGLDEVAPRLTRIEHSVEAVAIEIERIAEGQRFMTKMMVDHLQHGHQDVAARSDAGGVGEGSPLLALGAGPAEPIRQAERELARERVNTPH